MENSFNLKKDHNNLDGKIVAGFERLSQVFRVLLWEKAKKYDLSPIQIQLLIFLKHHSGNKSTVSYLAKEFNLTKATVSDTIKILEQKNYILKQTNARDSRSYTIELTAAGLEIVLRTEDFTDPLYDIVTETSENDKMFLWQNISFLIQQLHAMQIISVQSTCYNCHYFSQQNGGGHCKLMEMPLQSKDIRLDCNDHKPLRS